MFNIDYIHCQKDLNTDFTLGNCLLGAIKLTKKAYPDKYKYSGYSTGFNPLHNFHGQMEV